MFLNKVRERNNDFVEAVKTLHSEGTLGPDTYVIDMDMLKVNARLILEEARKENIELYFMLKQIGRNPEIGKVLMEMGYKGAVVVDSREAEVMMRHGIPLGNVGHLVQTPSHLVEKIVDYGTEVFTVFSMDKLIEINNAAIRVGKVQDVIVKVSSSADLYYSGQMSGIDLTELSSFIDEAALLENVSIVGATAFPCYLYDARDKEVKPTPNYYTVIKAIELMRQKGLTIKQINVPSTTCVSTLKSIAKGQGTMGEPGHGLTGTTPAHAHEDLEEKPAVLYLSEVSHNFRGRSYAYGGGHYRRSHVENALIYDGMIPVVDHVTPVDDDSIDYYFELSNEHNVGSCVIMAFRFQMFVTRSNVALLEGVHEGKPHISGIYDGLGNKYE